ncbi:hypothetical protein ACJX0J_034664 [Zea mays]
MTLEDFLVKAGVVTEGLVKDSADFPSNMDTAGSSVVVAAASSLNPGAQLPEMLSGTDFDAYTNELENKAKETAGTFLDIESYVLILISITPFTQPKGIFVRGTTHRFRELTGYWKIAIVEHRIHSLANIAFLLGHMYSGMLFFIIILSMYGSFFRTLFFFPLTFSVLYTPF